MTTSKWQTGKSSVLAATLFISGCTTNTATSVTANSETGLCCLTCAKPENGCKAYNACRHGSSKIELPKEKCTALGGLIVAAEK